MAQPFLHQLVACVRAPTNVLSGTDGQVRHAGAGGLFCADVRHLAELIVEVAGAEPLAVGHTLLDGSRARFVSAVMNLGDPIPDPTVRLERERLAVPGGVIDELTLVNDSRRDIEVEVVVRAATDMASIGAVKHGSRPPLVAPASEGRPHWACDGRRTALSASADGRELGVTGEGERLVVRWPARVPARGAASLTVTVTADGGPGEFTAAPAGSLARPEVAAAHPALGPLLRRSLDDLDALLLADGDSGDVFAAAGTPWYLTLFGRDSLWAARFAVPVDTRLASGTLRTLARRQATVADVDSSAEPGKILHEVRTGPLLAGLDLPARYYGTVDATPLWISVLHDAWCWGAGDDLVAELLDPLQAAVGWVVGRRGFLSYVDESGHGLTNQGWKDSSDSIQDGRAAIAEPPITLCEVQGYAHRAALDGARLLDAFDRPGADVALAFAAGLEARFRTAFWTTGRDGRFPAVALDGSGHAVDSLTSNIGHLPASGLLDAAETATVAGHLGASGLDSGYGLRTLADDHPGYNPLGYHTGSVWPHDTVIAIDGLAASGHGAVARRLADGLLAAASHFGSRLPELYGGWPAGAGPPFAYPAACRPQAWAAASAVVLVRAALGLRADVPAGVLEVRPDPAFADWFPLAARGLRIGPHRLDVAVDEDGRASVSTDAAVRVVTG